MCECNHDYIDSYPIWYYREWSECKAHKKSHFCPACGQPLTEPKALTLEELRERDGRPVWIESTGTVILRHLPKWTIAETYNIVDNYNSSKIICECFRAASGRGLRVEDYGRTWLAYDYPPKEGQR